MASPSPARHVVRAQISGPGAAHRQDRAGRVGLFRARSGRAGRAAYPMARYTVHVFLSSSFPTSHFPVRRVALRRRDPALYVFRRSRWRALPFPFAAPRSFSIATEGVKLRIRRHTSPPAVMPGLCLYGGNCAVPALQWSPLEITAETACSCSVLVTMTTNSMRDQSSLVHRLVAEVRERPRAPRVMLVARFTLGIVVLLVYVEY